MMFYIKSNGKIYGPTDEEKIKFYVKSGFFSLSSQTSTDLQKWQPLDLGDAITNEAPTLTLSPENEVPHFERRPSKSAPAPARPRKLSLMQATCIAGGVILLILLLCAGGIIYMLYSNSDNSRKESSPKTAKLFNKPIKGKTLLEDFAQVCQQYQGAVGVVVATLENSNGKPLPKVDEWQLSPDQPIGTAFAISGNKFATNSHVAYALKDQKGGIVKKILLNLVFEKAIEQNVKSEKEFQEFCKKHEQEINKFRTFLEKDVRIRDVEIRLSSSNGHSLRVSHVQVHPRYNDTNDSEDAQIRNGEYDVAILTTDESINTFFPIAPKEKLYALKKGQPIAYLGFPMEGLMRNGDVDLDKPEATFKDGSISRVSDFDNHSTNPELNKSIIHNLPSTGGASGSPIFLKTGEVVAILWGITPSGTAQDGSRLVSAVQHNYAVRIDALDAVKNQPMHKLRDWIGEKR